MRAKDLEGKTEAKVEAMVKAEGGEWKRVSRWLKENDLRRFLEDYQSPVAVKKAKTAEALGENSNPVAKATLCDAHSLLCLGSSPLKSHFGDKAVDMTVEGVLGFLVGLQRVPKLRQPDVIHSEVELALKLCGRETAKRVTVEAFQARRMSLLLIPPPQDRTEYPMVVCSGMKGLGKTRMLEEWPQLFRDAQIPEPHLGVFVSYGNGFAPKDFENRMPIEAAVGWRMLHRLFVEDNCTEEGSNYWFDRGFLPGNADELLLHVALQVVRAGAERFGIVKAGETLSLFFGVDEYQKIPVGPDYDAVAVDQHTAREQTLLWKLISALDGCRKVHGLHIYPGFAGTRWGPLSIAGSSVPGTRRVPLTLLSSQAMEDVVRSNADMQAQLVSPDFRRKLFFLGGIPRPSVKFALGRETFDSVWSEYVVQKWTHITEGLNSAELLRLVAVAVSGMQIQPADNSGIKNHTWGRLFEEGMCLPLDDGQLGIPYCVFRLAAGIDGRTIAELPAKCLTQNLQYLRDHVDNVLFVVEPWQLWEKFGACFFAMRVNALLLLGSATVPFSWLCLHAAMNGCNYNVELRAMEVHAIEDPLSAAFPKTVNEKKDHRLLNWLTGDGGVWYCLINGTRGRGVDVFSALPLAGAGGGVLLYLDQRKVEAKALGALTARNLLAKADIVPNCLPANSKVVRGLFSLLSSFNQQTDQLPKDTFVLSYHQHHSYHGTLSGHPACRSFVDVNFDNVSTLRLLKSVASVADEVIVRRATAKFESVESFAVFCQQHGRPLSEADAHRVAAYAK